MAGVSRDALVDVGGGRSRLFAVEFPLDVEGYRLLVSADPSLPAVRPGNRVYVRCTLMVIADYQWESFDLPDVRRDWRVSAVLPRSAPAGGVDGYPLDLVPLPA